MMIMITPVDVETVGFFNKTHTIRERPRIAINLSNVDTIAPKTSKYDPSIKWTRICYSDNRSYTDAKETVEEIYAMVKK